MADSLHRSLQLKDELIDQMKAGLQHGPAAAVSAAAAASPVRSNQPSYAGTARSPQQQQLSKYAAPNTGHLQPTHMTNAELAAELIGIKRHNAALRGELTKKSVESIEIMQLKAENSALKRAMLGSRAASCVGTGSPTGINYLHGADKCQASGSPRGTLSGTGVNARSSLQGLGFDSCIGTHVDSGAEDGTDQEVLDWAVALNPSTAGTCKTLWSSKPRLSTAGEVRSSKIGADTIKPGWFGALDESAWQQSQDGQTPKRVSHVSNAPHDSSGNGVQDYSPMQQCYTQPPPPQLHKAGTASAQPHIGLGDAIAAAEANRPSQLSLKPGTPKSSPGQGKQSPLKSAQSTASGQPPKASPQQRVRLSGYGSSCGLGSNPSSPAAGTRQPTASSPGFRQQGLTQQDAPPCPVDDLGVVCHENADLALSSKVHVPPYQQLVDAADAGYVLTRTGGGFSPVRVRP